MAEVARSRLSLDLEEIERQLRQSSQQPASSRSDPLAELARIVGQDDPFRTMLAAEQAALRGTGKTEDVFSRRAPSFDPIDFGREPAARPGLRGSLSPHEPAASPHHYADERMALTAEEAAILHGHEDGYPAHEPQADQYYDEVRDYAEPETHFVPEQPRRSRKALFGIAAAVGALAIGIAGALTLRGGSPSEGTSGEPPIVRADGGPLKVAPQDPGGVEIPNQSKQIYERSAQDTQTRVVNREEQPIDVRQATRSAGIPANPSMQRLATDALGEPRRVRTVTIRPSDGAIVMPDQSGAARAVAAPPVADPSPATPAKVLPPQRPRDATSTPAPRPGPGASATEVPVRPSAQNAAEASPPRMAAAPQTILREPTETSAAPVISPGFTVQLGVRNTDRDARSLFDQLQQRYGGDLKGFSPIVREAEINGKTAYRLRVGPMSREDATSLCVRLKSAGGQCFVANN